MGSGFIGEKKAGRKKHSFILRTALVLSILAAMLITLIFLTVSSANNLMRIGKTDVSSVPSNILPNYSVTSFTSADNQTSLQGWFFKTKNPISTVIVVHDTGKNRLQFGVDMIDMVETWLNNNYNVFLFDLRHSGTSEGDTSAYGYLEYRDVLGAVAIVKQISVTTDVVLYGIGTGCTACVLAYDALPDEGISEIELKSYPSNIASLGFDKSYICGMIFDSPAKSSDDYIKPIVQQNEPLGFITKNFVPYAIRISSGSSSVNLATSIARLPIPVQIIYGGHDTFIGADKISQIIKERERINSNLTKSKMISGAGYLEAYTLDRTTYIDSVMDFLNNYFAIKSREGRSGK